MNLSAIRAFVLTAQFGSISQAAKRMKKNRVQVSQWIAGLEDDWNNKVFDRTKSSVTLTIAGEHLLRSCESLLQAQNELDTVAMSLVEEKTQLTLGISYSLPAQLVSSLTNICLEHLPNTNVRIVQMRDESLLSLIHDKQLDIAVLNYMHAHSVPDDLQHIGEYMSISICAPTHPLSALDKVKSKDLLKYYFISMPLEKAITPWELPKIVKRIEAGNLETIKQLVVSGSGFAALPKWYIEKELTTGHLVEIKHPDAKIVDKLGLLPFANTADTRINEALRKELRSWIKQIV
ncbi:LysR family transcriptional regulator [Shewanella sp. TC10]|uniref:LysR family transcriptional regulator n=1 Tax=Shewanella sp. TC10 TaxID=1419739 RepID=UPI00129DDEE4|nr:LysR family transcriptional regulator [Shewanella sp. TC10]